jgi:hypothetical protein
MSLLPSGTRFPTEVISTIKPVNGAPIPVMSDVDIEGGYQVRTSINDRNSIPEANRKEGMLVFVKETKRFYTLVDGIADLNWTFANIGNQNISYDLTENASEITVGRINNLPAGLIESNRNTAGHLAVKAAFTNNHLFLQVLNGCTDGSHIWSACSDIVTADKAEFTKTVLVDYGASYGLTYASELGTLPGKDCVVNTDYSPYLFLATQSQFLFVTDRDTDKIVGFGETNADPSINIVDALVLDGYGDIWVASTGDSSHISKFITEDLIADYPSVTTTPAVTIDLEAFSKDLVYDGYDIWSASFEKIERINTISATYISNYNSPGNDYKGILTNDGYIYAVAADRIHRFNKDAFPAAPDKETLAPDSVVFGGGIVLSNGFIWATDLTDGYVVQFDLELNIINKHPPPNGSNSSLSIISNPYIAEIYISGLGVPGFYTFDTQLLQYKTKRFYTQSQPAQVILVPAICNTTNFPEDPFIGQMVFVGDLPTPLTAWWNGVAWVDATGDSI